MTSQNLNWAFSMLLSRLVRLPSLGNIEALCPWADMINHDCRATSYLDFDPSKRCATLTTDRGYKAGEQVSHFLCRAHLSFVVQPSWWKSIDFRPVDSE